MKKATSLFLAAILCLCCLSGCGLELGSLEDVYNSVSEADDGLTEKSTAATSTAKTTTTERTTTTSTTERTTTERTTTSTTTSTTKKVTTTTKAVTTVQPDDDTGSVEMVWIPNSGKKYHSRSGCSNMKNPTQVTKQQAINMGYGPCKKCY